jgi:phosphoribosylamine--glycine ligase
MNIMIIGSGGREAAIAQKIKENKDVENLYVLPGNAGMQHYAQCIDIAAMDFDSILKFSKDSNIDFAIVAPDDPLVAGLVDLLEDNGIKCFGPNKKAAIIEGSKSFSKSLMKKYNIPTADYEEFTDSTEAIEYAKTSKYPLVIKADGLALGKGVSIVSTFEEAKETIISFLDDHKFSHSSDKIIIEEFLEGPEISLLTFTDGKNIAPMISSMDHKNIGEGDVGPNTGGMGAIAPNPFYTGDVAIECIRKILYPTMLAMNKEGRTFKGCLYFGLMLTQDGVKVIEYNCRFGDPETQVVLPLLKTDLLSIMMAVENETLGDLKVEFSEKSAANVVLASKGYPLTSTKDLVIKISDLTDDAYLYTAGVKMGEFNHLVTNGGRVLSVTCVEDKLEDAVKEAYKNIHQIFYKEKVYRSDIGHKALEYLNK